MTWKLDDKYQMTEEHCIERLISEQARCDQVTALLD